MVIGKNIKSIAFIDTEIEPNSKRILDIGGIKTDGNTFHKTSVSEFILFLKDSEFVCGHNISKHDIKFVGHAIADAGVDTSNIIDTLFLSPLLFPSHPYHALVKNDKLYTEDRSNPLNDSIKAREICSCMLETAFLLILRL